MKARKSFMKKKIKQKHEKAKLIGLPGFEGLNMNPFGKKKEEPEIEEATSDDNKQIDQLLYNNPLMRS